MFKNRCGTGSVSGAGCSFPSLERRRMEFSLADDLMLSTLLMYISVAVVRVVGLIYYLPVLDRRFLHGPWF